MLKKYLPEQLSIVGVLSGAVVGALMGVIVSLLLMNARASDRSERVSPTIGNYVRLGIAMIMFARQASELIAPPPKQQA